MKPCCLTLLLACLLSGATALALDLHQPAHLRVRLEDPAGKPVPKTIVKVFESQPNDDLKLVASGTSAADGWLEFALTLPGQRERDEPIWSVRLNVEAGGIWPRDHSVQLIPGAKIERHIRLDPEKITWIKLRGPKGQPLAGAQFDVSYGEEYWIHQTVRTDDQGQFRFVHPPLKKGFEVHLANASCQAADEHELTLTLSPQQLEELLPRHRLEGILLLPDGRPALGWQVGEEVLHTGEGGGGSGGIGPWDTVYSYSVRRLLPVGVDGRFRLDPADDRLIVVSPEGVPFLYRLNPISWPKLERRVTLTVPPVRRVNRGTLVSTDGLPMPGLDLAIRETRSESARWNVTFAGMPWPRGGLLLATNEQGRRLFNLVADARGDFQMPIYFGARTQYGLDWRKWRTQPFEVSSGARIQVTPERPAEPRAPVDFKMVTVRFVDAKGQVVTNTGRAMFSVGVGPRDLENATFGVEHGEREIFLFVKREVGRVVLKTPYSTAWDEFTNRFTVTGIDDKEFVVTLPETSRHRALDGIILGPNGLPATNVTVSFYTYDMDRGRFHYMEPGPGGKRSHRFQLWATTGADGRFHLDAAPDECVLELHRFAEADPKLTAYSQTDSRWSLPGWSEPPVVTKANRNLTIQLQPGGTVRVLVSIEQMQQSDRFSLQAVSSTFTPTGYLMARATNENAVVTEFVRPGEYHLTSYSGQGSTNVATVTVRADEETVVDLRHRNLRQITDGPLVWVDVRVRQHNRPARGAVISLFPHTSWMSEMETADLSDDSGAVRFRVEAGAKYTVVGRQAGRALGWKTFTAHAGQSQMVELGDCRTLDVTLGPAQEASGDYDSRSVAIELPGVLPTEAWAIWRALDINAWEPTNGTGHLKLDAAYHFVAEDLLVDRPIQIDVRQNEKSLARRLVTLGAKDPVVGQLPFFFGPTLEIDEEVENDQTIEDSIYAKLRRWGQKFGSASAAGRDWIKIGYGTGEPLPLTDPPRKAPVKSLHFDHVKIPESGLRALGWFYDLEWLELRGCVIDERDFLGQAAPEFGSAPALNELGLPVVGPIPTNLKRFAQLQKLDLSQAEISVAALAALRDLPNLKELSLRSAPQITDGVFPHLALAKNLTAVDLRGTGVSMQALRKYQKKHPAVKVTH